MTAFLVAVVALPGLLALFCLGVSFAFPVDAVAAGEHLGPFQGRLAACSGCGLCGMSRAFAAFAHADFSAAWALHRGVFVAWPMMCLMLVTSAFGASRILRDPPRFFASEPTRSLPTEELHV